MERAKKRQKVQAAAVNEEEDEEEGEEEEDEGEESEEELEISIDEDGRTPLHGCGPPPEYRFRSFPKLLQDLLGGGEASWLDDLRKDCEAAFTARAAKKGEYSAGETFWVGADVEEPATVLEQLALAIFRLHAGLCTFDRATSGVEWWTQVIDADDDIGWHWDRDYGLEADAGFRLHPHVATVTYLSDLGAPTLMLEGTEEPEEGNAATKPIGVPVAHWSAPSIGKHVSFDGRWLHGAPADLAPEVAQGGASAAKGEGAFAGKRFTFLVNIWLNHRPRSVVPWTLKGRLRAAGDRPLAWTAGGPSEDEVKRVKALGSGEAGDELRRFSWELEGEDEGEE
eukprot:CAMPEP_0203914674 /NCGR_PEP_ID=MMETSP0359-20131031/55538_1 /ASSEMBLY_ACC=CAM_ASM_000338 /TAXON_ID=268821 /ORGANISM="Scrippsiella Hangoei, Strain SHTV-5" /LENGTH=338 /DNA_ID=CAMNT_0050841027 /DNA_START=50 /DNA_END=1063 /DNA_ORIENTATION=-